MRNSSALGLLGLAVVAVIAINDRARLAALDTFDELTDMTNLDAALENANVRAFLKMIRWAEGTADANGYRRIFGGQLFNDFADHPRVRIYEKADEFIRNGKKDYTTAAGAYQITASTWDSYRARWGVADFTPPSQDYFAVGLIRKRGALADVVAGRIEEAIRKCRAEWASLPGNEAGQPQKKLAGLLGQYQGNGGTIA